MCTSGGYAIGMVRRSASSSGEATTTAVTEEEEEKGGNWDSLMRWNALEEAVQQQVKGTNVATGSFQLRPKGAVPSTSADAMRASGSGSVSMNIDEETKLPREGLTLGATKPGVLLYRDTNAWCPFCERVWIAIHEKGVPYESVGVDLRNKPAWYKEMIPTALVPSVRFFPDDELVYESKDILLALERHFPNAKPLLPHDAALRARAMELIEAAESDSSVIRQGYKLLLAKRNGRTPGRTVTNTDDKDEERKKEEEDDDEEEKPEEPDEATLRASFTASLADFDAMLAEHGGPFLMGADVSIPDFMFIPGMLRLAANLRTFADYELRYDDAFPHVKRWYSAIDDLDSVRSCRSDDETLNTVVGKIFMGGAVFDLPPQSPLMQTPPLSRDGQLEAAFKLISNHERVVDDILLNGGISADDRDDVDVYVRALAQKLLHVTIGDGLKAATPKSKVIGAASMSFLRNRVTSPRDMSGSACVAFRDAADRLAKSIY